VFDRLPTRHTLGGVVENVVLTVRLQVDLEGDGVDGDCCAEEA
jgi:hypothetical protein